MDGAAIFKERLNEQEIKEVNDFVREMAATQGLIYKLDVDTLTVDAEEQSSHILGYEDGALSGYAAINGNHKNEDEVTFICRGEQSFHIMHEKLMCSAPGRSERILAIANRCDVALIEWLKCMGYSFLNTELRMAFNISGFKPLIRSGLVIRNAYECDRDIVLVIDKESFKMGGSFEISQQDLKRTRVAIMNDEIVGKLRTYANTGIYGIYGFAIKTGYRGQGFGKAFLSSVLNEIIANGYEKIYLEVSSENKPAAGLYQSLGFREEAVFDYYFKDKVIS